MTSNIRHASAWYESDRNFDGLTPEAKKTPGILRVLDSLAATAVEAFVRPPKFAI